MRQALAMLRAVVAAAIAMVALVLAGLLIRAAWSVVAVRGQGVLDVLMVVWTVTGLVLLLRGFVGNAPTFVLRASKKSRRKFHG